VLTAVAGEGAQTLEGAAREWEKFRLELKRTIPGYASLSLVRVPKSDIQIDSINTKRKVGIYCIGNTCWCRNDDVNDKRCFLQRDTPTAYSVCLALARYMLSPFRPSVRRV